MPPGSDPLNCIMLVNTMETGYIICAIGRRIIGSVHEVNLSRNHSWTEKHAYYLYFNNGGKPVGWINEKTRVVLKPLLHVWQGLAPR